mmetsp:Transcript_32164/g.91253  ORF Transcript_32164/g.91253 Transcript_32164/m.91253 type:complete len:96 (-) Transcript_32164:220-507(-)
MPISPSPCSFGCRLALQSQVFTVPMEPFNLSDPPPFSLPSKEGQLTRYARRQPFQEFMRTIPADGVSHSKSGKAPKSQQAWSALLDPFPSLPQTT